MDTHVDPGVFVVVQPALGLVVVMGVPWGGVGSHFLEVSFAVNIVVILTVVVSMCGVVILSGVLS